MTAASPVQAVTRRQLYLDRKVCSVTADKIDIHPARSIVILPLLTLLFGLAAFPVIYFWGNELSIPLRLGLTLAALILVPVSGIGLVYSIGGANIVVDRRKQSIVQQQGYLGMGVGTQELILILQLSGREIPIGLVTVARFEAEAGLARAREIADLVGEMSGAAVEVAGPPATEPVAS
jgi:hypothetical protein